MEKISDPRKPSVDRDMRIPTGRNEKPKGSHMSDRNFSEEKFYKEVYADERTMRTTETLSKDYSKDRKNLEPKHKGRKQQ